jgi:hypothetical protein
VAPPLALLPLVDVGGGSDVDCRALIQEARISTETTERIARPGSAKPSQPPRTKLARKKD